MPKTIIADPRSAVFYRRVSTPKQAEQGTSLDKQIEECHKYALAHDLHFVRDFCDAGFTGTTANRPAMNELLDFIESQHIANVVCYVPDRQTRSSGAGDLIYYLIQQAGARLHFTDIGEIKDDDSQTRYEIAKLVAGIQARSIRHNTADGKAKAVRLKGKVLAPIAPYGYRRIRQTSTIEIVESEAVIVRRIFADYCAGKSISAIAGELNQEHIPTRQVRKKKPSNVWRVTTIADMLRRTVYKGEFTYHSRMAGAITIAVPDIISASLWNQAQLPNRWQIRQSRNVEHNHLFSGGRLRCEVCGGALVAITKKERFDYYTCNGNNPRKSPDGLTRQCRYTLRAKDFDKLLWKYIAGFLADPAQVDAHFQRIESERQAAQKIAQRQMDSYSAELARLRAKQSKFLALFADDELPKTALKMELQSIEETISDLEIRHQQAQADLAEQMQSAISVPQMIYTLDPDEENAIESIHAQNVVNYELASAGATLESRRAWLERLNVRVSYCHPDKRIAVRIGDLSPILATYVPS